jgi:uncharacterized iron-regulated membrane protein
MKLLRRLFFWLHLIAGVCAGLVIFVMAVTGVALTYERQMLDWANRDLWSAPTAAEPRLPPGTLLAKAAEWQGASPSGATWRSDAAAPVTVTFGRDSVLYVNPYTGAVLGEGAKAWREFFHLTTDLHRWLAMEGEKRPLGKGITGAGNLAFLFLTLSGIYLWWPRQWRWKAVKSVLCFDARLRGKMRDFNWHNVLGFWASLPLVVIIASGAIMSYSWANNLLFQFAGSAPPPPRAAVGPGGPPGGGPRRGAGAQTAANFDHLNPLVARAEQHVPGWQMISWRAPGSFMIDLSHRGRPDKRTMLTLDPKTAAVVSAEPFASNSRGRQWRMWARWLHTGEAGGFWGQTLAGLASAAAAVLVFTGLALSVRRFASWRKKGGQGSVPTELTAQPLATSTTSL